MNFFTYFPDIDECRDKNNFPCYGHCDNTPGSYNCTCLPGHTGDARTADGCRPVAKNSKFPAMVFCLGILRTHMMCVMYYFIL